MEAGEDNRTLTLLAFGRRLDVNEPAEDVEQRIALPYLFPQIRRAVTRIVRRVSCSVVVPKVVVEPTRALASEPRGHPSHFGVDSEVNNRALQSPIRRVAIVLVLLLRMLSRLTGEVGF